jgi:acyl-CoA thioesterase-1
VVGGVAQLRLRATFRNRRTMNFRPFLFLTGFAFALPALFAQPAVRTVLFLGDSLTAGYGLEDPAAQAYPALIQQKLDALISASPSAVSPPSAAPAAVSTSAATPADGTPVAVTSDAGPPGTSQSLIDKAAGAGGVVQPVRWRVVNAGVSGDTTSGGLRRIDWVLRQPVDILVLALGANDGLRGLPTDLIRNNLIAIAAKVRAKNPSVRVLLAGMKMPSNMGDYAAGFDRIYPDLAAAQGWPAVPFLLEGVGGVVELNQADAIHPNAAGHKRIADNVWPHLFPLL